MRPTRNGRTALDGTWIRGSILPLCLIAGAAGADCPKTYRLIRLVEVPDPNGAAGVPEGTFPVFGKDNTFGINNNGQVVGTMTASSEGTAFCGNAEHYAANDRLWAFLWLPNAAFGLAASPADGCADTVYNLHALGGLPSTEFSFANDISTPAYDGQHSDAAYVVGTRLCFEDQARAIAWRLHAYSAGPPAGIPVVDVTPGGGVLGGMAYAVSQPMQLMTSDQDYYVAVVGKGWPACVAQFNGFLRHIGSAGNVHTSTNNLGPSGNFAFSTAVDIDGPLSSQPNTLRAVGYSQEVYFGPPCTELQLQFLTCETQALTPPTYWKSPAYGPQSPGPSHPNHDSDGQMRGVNRQPWTAGWGRSGVNPTCLPHAVVTDLTNESDIKVYDITRDPDEVRHSRAEAISEPGGNGLCTVVGWVPTPGGALVWRGTPGGNWCESDVTSITANDVDCVVADGSNCLPNTQHASNAHEIVIWQLHDVNDFSHAVGIMRERRWDSFGIPLPTKFYACVLGPVADLNEDLDVDAADLGILLGEWGQAISPANFFCSGVVGADDLGILLGMWSGPGLLAAAHPPTAANCECGGSMEGLGAGSAAALGANVEAALAELGFTSIAEFAAWVEFASEEEVEAAVHFMQQFISGSNGDSGQ